MKAKALEQQAIECEHTGIEREVLSAAGRRIGWACGNCGRPTRPAEPPVPRVKQPKKPEPALPGLESYLGRKAR